MEKMAIPILSMVPDYRENISIKDIMYTLKHSEMTGATITQKM